MRDDRLALIADARLPGDARVIGLFVLELGEGWHEVPHDQLRAVLDGPSDETIRRHLRKLEATGWIEADSKTGRRHPRYRICSSDESGAGRFRDALLASLPHTDEGQTGVSPTSMGGRGSFTPHQWGADSRSSSREVVVGGEVEARAREVLESHGEKFDGCRDSLTDYLANRVPPDKQSPYVQSLAGWLDGIRPGVWKRPDGGSVPQEQRTEFLAAALNELGSSDERVLARPVGDVANLKTKLSIIIRQEYDDGRAHRGSGARKAGGEKSEPVGGESSRRNFGFDRGAA